MTLRNLELFQGDGFLDPPSYLNLGPTVLW